MKGSLSQLENVLNSTLVNSNVNFNGVSIDSRTIKKGNLNPPKNNQKRGHVTILHQNNIIIKILKIVIINIF